MDAAPLALISFHATSVAVEEMDDCGLAGFADEMAEPMRYLLLQRSFEEDEQDVALGMDTYHIECNGQGQSCYGGILCFELRREQVIVSLDPEAASHLGASEIRIGFSVDEPVFERLHQRLQQIFEGTRCLVAESALRSAS